MNNKVDRNTYRPIFPTPAGLVVSVDAAGKPNIITLGEIFNLSIGNRSGSVSPSVKRVIPGISSRSREEFTVNLPPTRVAQRHARHRRVQRA